METIKGAAEDGSEYDRRRMGVERRDPSRSCCGPVVEAHRSPDGASRRPARGASAGVMVVVRARGHVSKEGGDAGEEEQSCATWVQHGMKTGTRAWCGNGGWASE